MEKEIKQYRKVPLGSTEFLPFHPAVISTHRKNLLRYKLVTILFDRDVTPSVWLRNIPSSQKYPHGILAGDLVPREMRTG